MKMGQQQGAGHASIEDLGRRLGRVDPWPQKGAIDPQRQALARAALGPACIYKDRRLARSLQQPKAHGEVEAPAPPSHDQSRRDRDTGLDVERQSHAASRSAVPKVTPAAVPSMSTRDPGAIRPARRA